MQDITTHDRSIVLNSLTPCLLDSLTHRSREALGGDLPGGGQFEGIGDGRGVCLKGGTDDIEDDDLVLTFFQPTTGDIEGLLGTNRPESANGVAIDINLAFAPSLHVEEGITGLFEGEVAAVVAGTFEH